MRHVVPAHPQMLALASSTRVVALAGASEDAEPLSVTFVRNLATQRGGGALSPFLKHPLSDLLKFRMLLDIKADFFCRVLNRFVEALQNRSDLCGRGARARFAESPQVFRTWPFGRAVQGKGQAVLEQVNGRGHEVVDGRKPCFAQYIVINNCEILQMRVTIAKRAVERN